MALIFWKNLLFGKFAKKRPHNGPQIGSFRIFEKFCHYFLLEVI